MARDGGRSSEDVAAILCDACQDQSQFIQWHKDNPIDELKPCCNEIDLDKGQIKEVIDQKPPWRTKFIGKCRLFGTTQRH